MKNGVYDSAPLNIRRLAGAIKEKDQLILKSNTGEQPYNDLISGMARVIYGQFLALKSDYYGSRINQVTYVDMLRRLSDELTREIKIEVPELHAGEIVVEIKKFISIG